MTNRSLDRLYDKYKLDPDTFEGELLTGVRRYILARCIKLDVPSNDVEDVTQDILFSLYNDLPKLNITKSLTSYLFVRTYNGVTDWFRDNGSYTRNKNDIPSTSIEQDAHLEYWDLNRVDQTPDDNLRFDLSGLDDETRRIGRLLLDGFSQNEIADILDIKLDTLKKKLYRLRKNN